MASLGMIAVGLYFIVWQYAAVGIPLVMSGMVLLKLQG